MSGHVESHKSGEKSIFLSPVEWLFAMLFAVGDFISHGIFEIFSKVSGHGSAH